MSSIAAQRSHPDLLAYSISCAALDQATRSLAVAWAPKRIRVNGVAFGSLMSASLQEALRDDDDMREAIIAATPLNRIASATEGERCGAISGVGCIQLCHRSDHYCGWRPHLA